MNNYFQSIYYFICVHSPVPKAKKINEIMVWAYYGHQWMLSCQKLENSCKNDKIIKTIYFYIIKNKIGLLPKHFPTKDFLSYGYV